MPLRLFYFWDDVQLRSISIMQLGPARVQNAIHQINRYPADKRISVNKTNHATNLAAGLIAETCIACSFSDLWIQLSPTVVSSSYFVPLDANGTLQKMAVFLCTHFINQKIINPGTLQATPFSRFIKAGVNVKAVLTSLNTAFLPISRSRFKQR